MLELTQPEELKQKGYRKKEVAYILAETEKLNNLGILQYEGTSYGLTNLLRYVCFSKHIKHKIDYYFLDSNYLLSFPKDKSLKDLEDLVKASERACCIVVGQIQSDLVEQVLNLLLSLRNMYKHKTCFLLEIKLKNGEEVENLPYHFKQLIANNYFFIEPLNQFDLLSEIYRMADKFDIKLNEVEAKDICISCKGNLVKAKEIITERHVKKIWKEQASQKTKGTLSLRGGLK